MYHIETYVNEGLLIVANQIDIHGFLIKNPSSHLFQFFRVILADSIWHFILIPVLFNFVSYIRPFLSLVPVLLNHLCVSYIKPFLSFVQILLNHLYFSYIKHFLSFVPVLSSPFQSSFADSIWLLILIPVLFNFVLDSIWLVFSTMESPYRMRFEEPKHKTGHFKVTRPELIKVNIDLRPPQLALGYGPVNVFANRAQGQQDKVNHRSCQNFPYSVTDPAPQPSQQQSTPSSSRQGEVPELFAVR